jgi:hypothetical protein
MGTLTEAVWHNSDLTHIIFSHASIASILRCQKVNRRFRKLSLLYLDHCLDIHQHLSRFFSDPEGFRKVQRRTSALISGSNALQFFDRSLYPDADLDLYVHRGRETELAAFLLKEGYEYRPSHFQARSFAEQDARIYPEDIRPFGVPWDRTNRYIPEDPALDDPEFDYDGGDMSEWGVLLLYTFIKQTSDGERQVQILVASSSPIECVLRFHCSTLPYIPYVDQMLISTISCCTQRDSMGCCLLSVPSSDSRGESRCDGGGEDNIRKRLAEVS